MNKQEHLEWAKKRALEYIETGELKNAFASMASDLNKHPETKDHAAIMLGMNMIMMGLLNTKEEMKEFINGFN